MEIETKPEMLYIQCSLCIVSTEVLCTVIMLKALVETGANSGYLAVVKGQLMGRQNYFLCMI